LLQFCAVEPQKVSMPGDEPIFEALQGGQKPFFDEKDLKARRARTRQKREALNSSGVFLIIDMPTITTGFAGCRANRGHRKMLTSHNISQHFREIDASRRRSPGNGKTLKAPTSEAARPTLQQKGK
jgi:hypothetical protein